MGGRKLNFLWIFGFLTASHFVTSVIRTDVASDSFSGIIFYDYAFSFPSLYQTSTTSTAHNCRMKCIVDPNCYTASAVPSSGSYECRTSNNKYILENKFTSTTTKSYIFYKRSTSYYPTDSGMFYTLSPTAGNYTEGKKLCAYKGQQLVIMKTMQEFHAAVDLVEAYSWTIGDWLVDMQLANKSADPIWGDGTIFKNTELSGNVALDRTSVGDQQAFIFSYNNGGASLKAVNSSKPFPQICMQDLNNMFFPYMA